MPKDHPNKKSPKNKGNKDGKKDKKRKVNISTAFEILQEKRRIEESSDSSETSGSESEEELILWNIKSFWQSFSHQNTSMIVSEKLTMMTRKVIVKAKVKASKEYYTKVICQKQKR